MRVDDQLSAGETVMLDGSNRGAASAEGERAGRADVAPIDRGGLIQPDPPLTRRICRHHGRGGSTVRADDQLSAGETVMLDGSNRSTDVPHGEVVKVEYQVGDGAGDAAHDDRL